MFRTAEEAVLGGVRPDSEHRLVRPSGEVRTVYGQGEVKRDASGRPYRMFGRVQDITDRKWAEEALQRPQFYLSEAQRLARYSSVFEVGDEFPCNAERVEATTKL